jgi:hypothetical protein
MTADPSVPPAVACTLGPGDFRQRIAWIAALNRDALQGRHRHGRRLELTYAKAAQPRVAEMVARERQCCAFLHFALIETADTVRLVIEAPDDVRDALDAVFAPFLADPETGVARGCTC